MERYNTLYIIYATNYSGVQLYCSTTLLLLASRLEVGKRATLLQVALLLLSTTTNLSTLE